MQRFFTIAAGALVTIACDAVVWPQPVSAEIPAIASRQRAEKKTFTDSEIIDGFLKTAFGAEYHLAGRVDRIRKYDIPVRVFADSARADRKALEQVWPSWVEFRDFNGTLIYFTTLLSYRCAITEVRYGLDGADPLRRFDLPACNVQDPFSIPDSATMLIKVPPKTKSIW